MQRRRRIAFAATASSVLVAGALTALALTVTAGSAQADGVTSCQGTGTPVACSVSSVTVNDPSDIYLQAVYSPDTGGVNISYSITCTLNGTSQTTEGASTNYKSAPAYVFPVIQPADPTSCTVTATASVPGTTSTVSAPSSPSPSASPTPAVGSLTLNVDYDPNTTATATATARPVTEVRGYDGFCMDDTNNSSAARNKIQLWRCNSGSAQSWTYSGSELRINGMCVNAKGNGKSGSKLILWQCTGAANEIFIHEGSEWVEKANNYKLCIDDPAFSTRGGTQLMVYTCNNGANQHWTEP
jgi:Ricin-type beta-trefoil lectin domain